MLSAAASELREVEAECNSQQALFSNTVTVLLLVTLTRCHRQCSGNEHKSQDSNPQTKVDSNSKSNV